MVLRFEYDKALVAAVKELPKRSFDPQSKEWVVPLHLYLDVAARLEAAGADVEFDDELRLMYEKSWVPPARQQEVTVGRTQGEYIVRFEYDPTLVEAAKGLPGRTFDASSKAWFVPIEDEEGTLRTVVKSFESLNCKVILAPGLSE